MLHNEFEALIGRTATEEEYTVANAMYMNCGNDIDKKTFCEDYKKHSDSIILRGIWMAFNQEVDAHNYEAQAAHEAREETDALRHELGMFLVDRAEHFQSGTLREKAIELLGLRGYIKAKIERGDDLWRRDMQALISEVIGGTEEIKEALK